jgi:hypothetical protein
MAKKQRVFNKCKTPLISLRTDYNQKRKYFRLLDVKKIPHSFNRNGNEFICSECRFLQWI